MSGIAALEQVWMHIFHADRINTAESSLYKAVAANQVPVPDDGIISRNDDFIAPERLEAAIEYVIMEAIQTRSGREQGADE